jgi:sugar O-acyltransferase (sialic acid O-acetyltransferase NeuD family)
MNPKKLILIGGGGHCRSCIDVIESTQLYTIVGVIDNGMPKGSKILNYTILGSDADIHDFVDNETEFLITVGQIESPNVRIKLANLVVSLGGKLATIIASTATVSNYTKIEKGTIIMHHCLVNAGSAIGENCIINSKALIEHDVVIEDNCHVSTGAIVNGGAIVHKNSFVGSGSVIIQLAEIPEYSFIKAHSLLKANL